jgi:hypothetical protein
MRFSVSSKCNQVNHAHAATLTNSKSYRSYLTRKRFAQRSQRKAFSCGSSLREESLELTEIIMDGEPLKRLEIHISGESGELMFMRGTTKTGRKIETLYMKGTL